jgi:hypothetical protein
VRSVDDPCLTFRGVSPAPAAVVTTFDARRTLC